MAMYEQDSDVVQWGLRLLDGDPPFYSGYYCGVVQNEDSYHGQYIRDHYDISDCTHVDSDEIIARTLQEEFSQLAVAEASRYSPAREDNMQESIQSHDWHCTPTRSYSSDHEHSHEDSDDMVPSSSCSSPGNEDEYSYSPEFADEYALDDEVGRRLNQMVPIPHVPRINGEIPSIDEASSDHERLLNRLQLFDFFEVKVQGDGNCQFRALSDQLYSTPDRHKVVRRQVVNQLRSHPEIYEGYVPMEYGDYLKKMSKSGEWGDHVTLQAAADTYGVKILVMTSFKDTCYIEILPINQKTKGAIFLSFWAEVHYNSIYFQGDTTSNEFRKKKKWWSFGNRHSPSSPPPPPPPPPAADAFHLPPQQLQRRQQPQRQLVAATMQPQYTNQHTELNSLSFLSLIFYRMETARTFLSSPPPFPSRTHFKNSLSSSVPAVTSAPTTSIARNFPTSVLLQEQRDEFRPLLNIFKEDKTFQATVDTKQMDPGTSDQEGICSDVLDQLILHSKCHSLRWPSFWNLMSSVQTGQSLSWSLTMQSITTNTDELMVVEPTNVIDLARKALSASKEAALLAQKCANLDDTVSTGLEPTDLSNFSLEEVKTVRSTRRLERQSKNRRVTKTKEIFHEPYSSRRAGVQKKINEGFDPKDPLRLFLWGPETKQLLTAKEESELIGQVQDLMSLENVKEKFKLQFGRDPTLVEWADAVGLSYSVMQSQLHSGNRSREKLINANLRMVVHIAKQYQGRGLSLQDLLQEGSMGLMKSIEKFKPQVGCRFATYAYWWIRQTVRKAIFQHSRTIRLPENVYHTLGKVSEAKRSYIMEGNHNPTKEELAKRIGITTVRLERLLYMARMPLSMQQTVWADQETTFQEITADIEVEIPELCVAKQLMRKHVLSLLNILNPRERKIIRLRYGIEDGKKKSLSEIGSVFGLSKERVRQLESRALYKLKQCLASHGLEAYADLLV
eukprot:XP_015574854.2 RNA polymerase sigma factor sigF, chloroplastic [Ricinus communis]